MKESSYYFTYLDFLVYQGTEPEVSHLTAAFLITRKRAAEVLAEWQKQREAKEAA